ncbi:MAG: hypothetical protein RL653_3071 [Pseudomonadota bacterium]|jgi:DNA-binding response OmpR family regulator
MEPSTELQSHAASVLATHAPPQVRLQARAVLVVDDDPDAREGLGLLVASWGYTPVLAGSAEEAERLAQYYLLEAAVVDVFLPGKSGEQLLGRLRAAFPAAVLVGMSALVDPALERLCEGMGADLFLGKPVSPGDLARALTR